MTHEPLSPQTSELEGVERELRRHLHENWRGYAFQGGLTLVIGVLAIIAPFAATYATVLFFGWLLLFGGLLGLFGAWRMRGRSGFRSTLLFTILVTLLGFVILFDPFAGAVTLTWLLAVFFLLSAVANFAFGRALKARGLRSWPLVLAALVNVALALYLVVGLPETAVFAVGLFLGISFVMSGSGTLFAALEARRDRPA
ncbi:HdeD family acid-resistance protein [Aureimonas populi]|uniref:HdeD family acid-resistance protein n=1 Tax=Aureimonas populi TaxID=1701758 RepID=A0ABW5CS49_9HYPH|nr:DUF308 domain-containing protein [Aureimonas populi]